MMSGVSADPAADDQWLDPADLLPLALSRPDDALVAARSLLAGRPTAYDASFAHQTIGIVLRDHGDLPRAIKELRKSLELASASGRPEREVDVQATLGIALAWAGRSKQGLALLDRAVEESHGAMAARVLMRRALVLRDLGRFQEAYRDLSRALPYLRRAKDSLWEARTLTWRAWVFLNLGLARRASVDYARAEELFRDTGQELEYAKARHNRGSAALYRGELPEALTYFDEAQVRYDALKETNPDLDIDRCTALLAAGLVAEAAREADAALGRIPPEGGNAYKRAELLIAAATAALAASDPARAEQRAQQARRLFLAQGRGGWAARADLVVAQARFDAGERSAKLFSLADRVAASLEEIPDEAMRAHLLAARLALSRAQADEADRHFEHAARRRRRGLPLTRSVAWLARALQAEARGESRAVLAACRRGLDALGEHQMSLGAIELRAFGTAHGAEIAMLPQREALRRRDARRLLFWSERWRATALVSREAGPTLDRQLEAALSALRSVTRLLAGDEGTASGRSALERERRRLEMAVQARTRQLPAACGDRQPGRLDLGALIDELGVSTLIELVEVDRVLYAVTIINRQIRLHEIGAMLVAEREVELSRFTLRRLASNRSLRPDDKVVLAHRGKKLEESLLGPVAAQLGDGPVILVPPGRLHAVPWTLMPSLVGRVFSVAPSAATWLQARQRKPPAKRLVTLVVGPGLATGGAEVRQLPYPDAVVLGDGDATVARVLSALDGAWLAHIAAHGQFRSDNPLFSSIQLDDGPLIVHDFERLHRAPHQLVLSSCDSAAAAVVGADEVLGLASSLIPLGAVGIVASVVPVSDPATVPLMVALHDALHGGARLPDALLAARQKTGGDPMAAAVARSFLALGA
jgi:tetratricopeptide (TPR) repeat protein